MNTIPKPNLQRKKKLRFYSRYMKLIIFTSLYWKYCVLVT